MFLIMFNDNRALKKALDERDKVIEKQQRQIESYETQYEDDDYEAY